jgi:coniferyl-aldehyde dehydrogenase
MMKFADLVDQHIEDLAILDTINAGKLFKFGKLVDIPSASHLLRFSKQLSPYGKLKTCMLYL